MQHKLDLMDHYANYDNFIDTSIHTFFPELYKPYSTDSEKFNVAWILEMEKQLVLHPEVWPNFLATVEKGYEILESINYSIPTNADIRKNMYIASLTTFLAERGEE